MKKNTRMLDFHFLIIGHAIKTEQIITASSEIDFFKKAQNIYGIFSTEIDIIMVAEVV